MRPVPGIRVVDAAPNVSQGGCDSSRSVTTHVQLEKRVPGSGELYEVLGYTLLAKNAGDSLVALSGVGMYANSARWEGAGPLVRR